MTNTHFSKQQTSSQPSFMSALRRHAGISWLAVWLLVAGTFGYRALTHETAGQAVASVGATGLHDGSSKSLKPIERIEVGERVAFAINPTEGFDDSLGTEIHAHAWRKIELRPDAHSRVVLLRPEWWVNERIQDDSQTMAISIPEVGIHGDAEIVSITPCPRIPAGEGRVVIGTFAHLAQETIRLTIHGVSEPIRCTPNHATWSVEARDFVEAQDLQPGQHVLCRDGVYEIAKIEHLAEPIEVFNLEVFGQHVYQITTGGMLVHNAGPSGSGLPVVNKAVNSDIAHAAERAVTRGVSGDAKSAANALRELSKKIKSEGLPAGTIPDPKHADSVLVPFGEGHAVYEITKNGTAILRTVLGKSP